MSTIKLLQTPKIIEIDGATIRVAHPNISRYVKTYLAGEISAGGTGAVFYDNEGFSDDDWFVVGQIGDNWTEACDVNGAVTRGQSITVTNSLKFNHEIDAPVTKIFERGIKIYGAASIGAAGTLIASIDAITTPIADAQMIQWSKPYTEYALLSTDTTYAYYYVKFTDGVTDSSASVYVPYSGVPYSKIEPTISMALDLSSAKIKPGKLTREMFVDWANDFQDSVTQYVYQDPRTGRFLQKDWSFEVTRDESSLTIVEGQDEYDLTLLAEQLKYPNSSKSIVDIQIGSGATLKKITIKDFDILRAGANKTYVNGSHAAGATTLNVDSTSDFPSSGAIKIGSQTLTYTGTTATTFTGIPASGSGSITATIDNNSVVWQNMSFGDPTKYVIFNGRLYFDYAPSSSSIGKKIKIRYFKALPRITSVADGTEVTFVNVMTTFFVSRVYYRLGISDLGMKWDKDFDKEVLANAQSDEIPEEDEQIYYTYDNSLI